MESRGKKKAFKIMFFSIGPKALAGFANLETFLSGKGMGLNDVMESSLLK
jgi:hypothetical protein